VGERINNIKAGGGCYMMPQKTANQMCNSVPGPPHLVLLHNLDDVAEATFVVEWRPELSDLGELHPQVEAHTEGTPGRLAATCYRFADLPPKTELG
jgi:hypothetical protein